MDLLGYYFLPYMFCFVSFTWVCLANYTIIDETRFVRGIPGSVSDGGKINEAEVRRLREKHATKRKPQRTNCRLCGR
ncbi:hypothetical protein AAVH_24899 [Aphelenchoides avenae]|nr:hypothetical protein AAVH_24899 [Aphelenchus avenae]